MDVSNRKFVNISNAEEREREDYIHPRILLFFAKLYYLVLIIPHQVSPKHLIQPEITNSYSSYSFSGKSTSIEADNSLPFPIHHQPESLSDHIGWRSGCLPRKHHGQISDLHYLAKCGRMNFPDYDRKYLQRFPS